MEKEEIQILKITFTAKKLKHLALKEIHYQLINTSLILTCTTFNHCRCYEFSGCRLKPRYRRLSGERIYCLTCQLRIIYNIDKIYKIKKIPVIFNTYIELRNDLQQCLDQGYKKFWFYNYKTLGKRRFYTVYNKHFKGFFKKGYYKVISANP